MALLAEISFIKLWLPADESESKRCSTTAVTYQRGVDGLDLVLLKRSEARHLAAQVGVHQHLGSIRGRPIDQARKEFC